jgi:hypothetical protein
MTKTLSVVVAIALAVAAVPAAANKLVSPGPIKGIAKSSIAVVADGEWNRLSRSGGPNVEVWTRDGDNLNKVTFFGAVAPGMPIYKERDKKNFPLPKVVGNMLLPDIPVLFESTYRSQYRVNRMTIVSQELTNINGKDGIKFAYTYVRDEDEVERRGEAIGTIVNKKLYLMTYEAPGIHFFNKDLANFRQLAQTIKF